MDDRAALASAFLQSAGWADARRLALPIDASQRSYERLIKTSAAAILMNAPPGTGDDPADFVRIAAFLSGQGLSAPQIMAQDLAQGFLLLEDFGDAVFARVLHREPGAEMTLCTLAVDVLIHLARAPLLQSVPDLTAQDWAVAASMAVSDYAVPLLGPVSAEPLIQGLTAALRTHADGPRIFIHRDYHAENLMLLRDRTGLRRVGILDFQLGQAGQPGYDLVSFLQDARRDVSPRIEVQMVQRYCTALNLDPAQFAARYATLGAQRALRILGIFARQTRILRRPKYAPMMPRVWDQLQRNLAHPALSDLRAICANLPAPSAANLQRLAAP